MRRLFRPYRKASQRCWKFRLNQVLLNILSNAIKFTPVGGTISFRLIEEPSSRADTADFVFRIKIALEAGMNGHLAKPYDIDAIMRTLAEILK